MLKHFTNAFKGNDTDTIAINPSHVVSVYEKTVPDNEDKKMKSVTAIFSLNGVEWNVEESYLEVVARLNERD